jgi:transcriptional regulator with XRE-family HTH domain
MTFEEFAMALGHSKCPPEQVDLAVAARLYDHLVATGVDVGSVLAGADCSTVGQRVHALRHRKHWTMRQLASEAKVSSAFISQLENNQHQPGSRTVVKLAQALGVSTDFLLTGRRLSSTEPTHAVADEDASPFAVDADQDQFNRVALGLGGENG